MIYPCGYRHLVVFFSVSVFFPRVRNVDVMSLNISWDDSSALLM